jgi:hypothetical protein
MYQSQVQKLHRCMPTGSNNAAAKLRCVAPGPVAAAVVWVQQVLHAHIGTSSNATLPLPLVLHVWQ